MPPGRPSSFTQKIADEICERLGNGEPLAQICRDDKMPGLTTVYDWQNARETFSAAIARAREAGYDQIAMEALVIADTQQMGEVITVERDPEHQKDLEGGAEITSADGHHYDGMIVKVRKEDMLGHRKLQVETRLKLLAKWDPKRYGDKLDLTSAGEKLGLSTELEAARQRVAKD